jgi:hypothetical protein
MGASFSENVDDEVFYAETTLEGAELLESSASKATPGRDMTCVKRFRDLTSGEEVEVIDSVSLREDGIRWNISVKGQGNDISLPICTSLHVPNPEQVKYWTAWAAAPGERTKQRDSGNDPLGHFFRAIAGNMLLEDLGSGAGGDEDVDAEDLQEMRAFAKEGLDWSDPLVLAPLSDRVYWYGAPPWKQDDQHVAFCPLDPDVISIPAACVIDEAAETGLSIVLDPGDLILDLTMEVTADGYITFRRLHHRITATDSIEFSLDIVFHEPCWRASLAWMVDRYPEFFDAPAATAGEIAGGGAYSTHHAVDFDVEKMRRMGFRVNWKASFDFPYMGMFLPPVGDRVTWQRYKRDMDMSIASMARYSRQMEANGFHVLNYFNITEFGAALHFPLSPDPILAEPDQWQDAATFLHDRLEGAILHDPATGEPYMTWGGAVAMDVGEPAYQEFLLEQARCHVDKLPDSAGICIDRYDWFRMLNFDRDDGRTLVDGRSARSLITSYRVFMPQLAKTFHDAGKVVFCNNQLKRLDLTREIDGFYDEFTYQGSALNTTAFLSMKKPFIGWTAHAGDLFPDPDHYFQVFLYMGLFPTVPFPENDHTILPSPKIEAYYERYGPLIDTLRSRTWVLHANVIRVVEDGTKANLFAIPDGYTIPVVFGGDKEAATLMLRAIPDLGLESCTWRVLHPGSPDSMEISARIEEGVLELHVPLEHGCAVVIGSQIEH